jgi:triphosphoribosyl-dephospho-CoA synthetase
VARAVQEEARGFDERMTGARSPDTLEPELRNFDGRLKERRINPGTSADLVVATHFTAGLADAAGRS